MLSPYYYDFKVLYSIFVRYVSFLKHVAQLVQHLHHIPLYTVGTQTIYESWYVSEYNKLKEYKLFIQLET